ncbi:MAG: hypothetical protein R3284_07470, partial [Rubricoccaceae bacterium]|nr:hypothetical protein [Rubricoccaceae bacterium]
MPLRSPTSLPHDILNEEGAVWLEAARPDADTFRSGGRLFADPVRVLSAETGSEIDDLLVSINAALKDGFWVAGFLAYEAGYALEPTVFKEPEPGLLGWFGVYEGPEEAVEDSVSGSESFELSSGEFGIDRDAYRGQIDRIRAHIRAG